MPAAFVHASSRRLLGLDSDRGAASLDWTDLDMIDPPSAETLLDVDKPDALKRARTIALRR